MYYSPFAAIDVFVSSKGNKIRARIILQNLGSDETE